MPVQQIGNEREVGPQISAATFSQDQGDAERADQPGEAEAVEREHRPDGHEVGGGADDAPLRGCRHAIASPVQTPDRAMAAVTITATISSWPSAKLITRVT